MPAGDLTLAAVAARLGVSTPALYHWYRDKDALLAALGERALNRIELPADDLLWDEWVRHMAHQGRQKLLTTPLAITHLGAAPFRRAGMRLVDAALAVFTRDGFSELAAARAIDLVNRYVFVSALVESSADGPGPHRAAPAEIAATFDPADYPNLVAAAPLLLAADADQDFEDGLETLIAGIRARQGRSSNLQAGR
jgi:AcrR family transcriptional regulator